MNNSKTILVVDDSRVSRMMTSKFIQSHNASWEVVEAGTGEEAIEKVNAVSPALVIMDINMPGIGGTEAAENTTQQISPIKNCPANSQHSGSHAQTRRNHWRRLS